MSISTRERSASPDYQTQGFGANDETSPFSQREFFNSPNTTSKFLFRECTSPSITSARLPRNVFRSPGSSKASFRLELQMPNSSFVSQTKQKKKKDQRQELRPVLPRLWDKTCGTAINQSFSRKRLFSQPKQKILLPISDDEQPPSERSQRNILLDGSLSTGYPLFDPELSPLSKIMQLGCSYLPKSSEIRNDETFSDDNHIKLTPKIARRRLFNALKNVDTKNRSRNTIKPPIAPRSLVSSTHITERPNRFTPIHFESLKNLEFTGDENKDSSISSDSSPLIGRVDNSEWSP